MSYSTKIEDIEGINEVETRDWMRILHSDEEGEDQTLLKAQQAEIERLTKMLQANQVQEKIRN